MIYNLCLSDRIKYELVLTFKQNKYDNIINRFIDFGNPISVCHQFVYRCRVHQRPGCSKFDQCDVLRSGSQILVPVYNVDDPDVTYAGYPRGQPAGYGVPGVSGVNRHVGSR